MRDGTNENQSKGETEIRRNGDKEKDMSGNGGRESQKSDEKKQNRERHQGEKQG